VPAHGGAEEALIQEMPFSKDGTQHKARAFKKKSIIFPMKLFGYHGIFFKKALCYDNEIPGGVGNLIFEMSRLF
jgi:hypothetical protein